MVQFVSGIKELCATILNRQVNLNNKSNAPMLIEVESTSTLTVMNLTLVLEVFFVYDCSSFDATFVHLTTPALLDDGALCQSFSDVDRVTLRAHLRVPRRAGTIAGSLDGAGASRTLSTSLSESRFRMQLLRVM